MSVKAMSFSHWTLSGLNTFREALSHWTRLPCSLNYTPAVIFKHLLLGVVTFFSQGKCLAEKYAAHTAYMIELNLTVCTYVLLFKGGKVTTALLKPWIICLRPLPL